MELALKFQKGDKAYTVSDGEGVFKILEVEVYGHVYQDFEKDKPAGILYVFDLNGQRKFGNEDIMFATREDAIEKLNRMLPEYEAGYEKEEANLNEQIKNLKDHKDKLLSSAQELITLKPNEQ